MLNYIISFDELVTTFFNGIRNPILDIIMIIFTKAGDYFLIWSLIFIFVIFIKKHYEIIKKAFLIIITSTVIVEITKQIFKRSRPFTNVDLISSLVKEPASYSFPSGHSASSFVAATILAYYFPKYKYCFYLLAFLIALSRIYVGVHYFSDVVTGSLIGLSVGTIGLKLVNRLSK